SAIIASLRVTRAVGFSSVSRIQRFAASSGPRCTILVITSGGNNTCPSTSERLVSPLTPNAPCTSSPSISTANSLAERLSTARVPDCSLVIVPSPCVFPVEESIHTIAPEAVTKQTGACEKPCWPQSLLCPCMTLRLRIPPHPSDLRSAFLPPGRGKEEKLEALHPFPPCGGRGRGIGGFCATPPARVITTRSVLRGWLSPTAVLPPRPPRGCAAPP